MKVPKDFGQKGLERGDSVWPERAEATERPDLRAAIRKALTFLDPPGDDPHAVGGPLVAPAVATLRAALTGASPSEPSPIVACPNCGGEGYDRVYRDEAGVARHCGHPVGAAPEEEREP